MNELISRDSALLYEEQAIQDVKSMIAKWNSEQSNKIRAKQDTAYIRVSSYLEGLLDNDVFSLDELDEAVLRIAQEVTARSG
jgi:hypothetical protein